MQRNPSYVQTSQAQNNVMKNERYSGNIHGATPVDRREYGTENVNRANDQRSGVHRQNSNLNEDEMLTMTIEE